MPEGPSIVLLREAASIFSGRKVLSVSGNSKESINRARGKKVTGFKSWGKHFLICFSDFTIRVHLMLFGSYRINEEKDVAPRLSLKFSNGVLNFYACSIKIIEAPSNEIYDWSSDVMAPEWDEKVALQKLKVNPDMLVSDAVLDQNIFSGAGNIFKNEVLFRTGIHPLSRIGRLPDKKLKELVHEVRNYAFDFLEWKRKYELKKHWQAHTKKICPKCHILLTKEHLGKTNRRSFYCHNCQIWYK